MHQRAHTADALRKRPGVARIATAQDDLDAAHHGAGGVSLRDRVAVHRASMRRWPSMRVIGSTTMRSPATAFPVTDISAAMVFSHFNRPDSPRRVRPGFRRARFQLTCFAPRSNVMRQVSQQVTTESAPVASTCRILISKVRRRSSFRPDNITRRRHRRSSTWSCRGTPSRAARPRAPPAHCAAPRTRRPGGRACRDRERSPACPGQSSSP